MVCEADTWLYKHITMRIWRALRNTTALWGHATRQGKGTMTRFAILCAERITEFAVQDQPGTDRQYSLTAAAGQAILSGLFSSP